MMMILMMMIFRIREEWNGVSLRQSWLHSRLERVHTMLARTLTQYI